MSSDEPMRIYSIRVPRRLHAYLTHRGSRVVRRHLMKLEPGPSWSTSQPTTNGGRQRLRVFYDGQFGGETP